MTKTRKNGLLDAFRTKHVTYHRDVKSERRELQRKADAAARRRREELKREELKQRKLDRRTPLDSFMGVRRWKLGTGEVITSIDDSRFESAKVANDFIRSVKSNPPAGRPGSIDYKVAVTDRAMRYRAHHPENAPPAPKRCYCCGQSTEMIDHINGDESDTAPENLAWICRPCNVIVGNVLRKAGIGRLTHQYNPAGKGARNLGQWMNAVLSMKGQGGDMSVSDAVEMVRATSPARRSEYAGEIWSRRRQHSAVWAQNPAGSPEQYRLAQAVLSGTARNTTMSKKAAREIVDLTPASLRSRWSRSNPGNPESAAADLSEAWHGRRDDRVTDVVEKVRFHGVLTGLGRLYEVRLLVGYAKFRPIKFDKETILASNESGQQLYIEGGDQSLDLAANDITGHAAEKDLVTVARVYSVIYMTAKFHLNAEDKQYGPYEHVLLSKDERKEVKRTGRVTPAMREKLPDLVYDTMNQKCGFSGGRYHIDRDMDFGAHSAGIRD